MISQNFATGHRSAIRLRPPALGTRRISVLAAGTVVGVVAVWGPAAASPGTPSDRGPNAHGCVQTNLVSDQPGVGCHGLRQLGQLDRGPQIGHSVRGSDQDRANQIVPTTMHARQPV